LQARNRIVSAISCGVAARLTGTLSRKFSFLSPPPRESVEHFGLDRPRCHAFDAHAGCSALERGGLGQPFNGELAV